MSGPRIAILGDGVEAWLFAALFRQLSRHTDVLHVVAPQHWQGVGPIALPPVVNRAHQLLRIPSARLAAIGRPRYGIRIAAAGEAETLIPYGSYGDPEGMGNLVDAWIRLRSEGTAPDLTHLSANRTLMAGNRLDPGADPRLRLSIDAGWEVDAAGYRSLLEEAALSRGALRSPLPLGSARLENGVATFQLADGATLEADLFVDASEGHLSSLTDGAGWNGQILAIGTASRRMGSAEPFEIAAILSAAARLATLLPRIEAMPLLAREYDRLLATELVGMESAAAMLERLAGRAGPSEALDRYAARYHVAGLLPADPQPWPPDIWLSAFDAARWRPRRYDLNIDGFDRDRSTRRFDDWRTLIERNLRT